MSISTKVIVTQHECGGGCKRFGYHTDVGHSSYGTWVWWWLRGLYDKREPRIMEISTPFCVTCSINGRVCEMLGMLLYKLGIKVTIDR